MKPPAAHRFTAVLQRSDNKLWGCHVEVPQRMVGFLIKGRNRRVVRTLNGGLPRQCALLPHGNGRHVITVNKAEQKELGVTIGDEVRVTLTKDESAYGLPVPEELRELFRQDGDGGRLFHSLTAGKQRTLLYLIDAVKDPDRRAARALVVIRHLKANSGSINFRQLALLLRSPRG